MENPFKKFFGNTKKEENTDVDAKLRELGQRRLKLEERIRILQIDMNSDSARGDGEILAGLEKELKSLEEQSALLEGELREAA